MVEFKNKEITYRFSVEGYQFPDNTDGDYDSNWLNIRSEIRCSQGHEVRIDPALLTSELLSISDWFYTISQNDIPWSVTHGFIEPNFEFILYGKREDIVRFGIMLSCELRPQFAEEDEEFIMIFEYSLTEMESLSRAFKKEYELFPERK